MYNYACMRLGRIIFLTMSFKNKKTIGLRRIIYYESNKYDIINIFVIVQLKFFQLIMTLINDQFLRLKVYHWQFMPLMLWIQLNGSWQCYKVMRKPNPTWIDLFGNVINVHMYSRLILKAIRHGIQIKGATALHPNDPKLSCKWYT